MFILIGRLSFYRIAHETPFAGSKVTHKKVEQILNEINKPSGQK